MSRRDLVDPGHSAITAAVALGATFELGSEAPEDCCSGPVAWDHAVLIRSAPDPMVERELRARNGDVALETAMALREEQASVWMILHDARRNGRLVEPRRA